MWYELLMSFGSGMVGALLIHAGIARKVYNLQCDLATTQAQLLRERNQRASLGRSKDKEALELFNQLKQDPPQPVRPNPLAKFGIPR